ncbi:MAG: filamentous hemagglutinin N-terminal domain-containing protein [Blastochloris sp.]|nr:filamentous hemagglutinin N-terminal domain-containing protein [Blastochloris sp.]
MLKSDRGNLRGLHLAVRWIMFVLVFVFQWTPTALQANPSGGEVVAGQATIANSGTTTTINQATPTAVINWQDFSIASGELTKFMQPDASSAVLNKVIGNNVSQIYGTLEANGQVFLVNQSGIFVGAGGVINTAGFVASTLDLDIDTFMKGGDMKFAGNSQASIVNLGNINGTNGVFLISQKIENAGKITSANGEAGLAAGSEVLLKQSGDERTSVLVGSSADGTGISNKGEIAAAVATMKATGSMYSVAVNNEGIVRAQGVNTSGGRVRLTGAGGTVLSNGTISAKTSNETGGTVVVEGKNVGLVGNAVVDVSGKKGGGTALIGGDFQGSNPDVINAEKTFVGTGATIKADAEESGDGGKVIVWADNATTYQGNISARGGAQSGDGGFAEVSGKEVLAFTGTADLGAANGSRGTLLLDPKNIIIDGAGAATLADVDAFADTPAGDSFINAATINAAVADVILQANTDITQNAGATITLGANLNLTMQAGRSIILNDDITLAGTGAFTATINDAGADAGNRDAGLALFNMTTGSSITTAGGDVTVNVGTFGGLQTGVVLIVGASLATAGGNLTLLGNAQANNATGVNITSTTTISMGAGDLTVTGTGGTGFGNNGVTMSAVTITGSGAVNITGTSGTGAFLGSSGVLLGNDTTITQTGTGSVTLTGTAQTSGGNSRGVTIEESDISVVNGNMQITGTGSANGAGSVGSNGVTLDEDGGDVTTLTTSGAGSITVTGTRGAGTNFHNGVRLNGALIQSTVTGTGAILVQSLGGGTTTGSNNIGVSLIGNSDIVSLNTAGTASSITINGTGGGGSSSLVGVQIQGNQVSVSSQGGAISIVGTGGTGTSTGNRGCRSMMRT